MQTNLQAKASIIERVLSSLMRPGWPMPLAPFNYQEIESRHEEAHETETYKHVRPDLSAVLDSLGSTFQSLNSHFDEMSFIEKRTVTAIKKAGVYIPVDNGFLYKNLGSQTKSELKDYIVDPIQTPGFMSVSLVFGQKGNKKEVKTWDGVYPEFSYAIKHSKLPAGVERIDGTPFEFGMAYPFKSFKKLFWVNCYLVVRQSGEIHICKELKRSSNTVKSKSFGFLTIPSTQWEAPDFEKAKNGYDFIIRESFKYLAKLWIEREQNWSVSVRKGSNRAIFGINKKDTSYFFRKREKVLTETGKTKPIFHFVREHTRINGSDVKEHTRGLRDFSWNGFSCRIKAPEFDGATSSSFCLSAEIEENKVDGVRYVPIDDFAETLASIDDMVFSKK